MGTLTDPVTIYVATYSQDSNSSTRSNNYTTSTTLANYVTDVNSFATPLMTAVTAERAYSSSRVDLHLTCQIGTQASSGVNLNYHYGWGGLATPSAVAHMTIQDQLSDIQITTGADIKNWITNVIATALPVNIYPDVNYR